MTIFVPFLPVCWILYRAKNLILLSWCPKARGKTNIPGQQMKRNRFLLASGEFQKSHAFGIGVQRPKEELLHWVLHGPLLLTAECFWLLLLPFLLQAHPAQHSGWLFTIHRRESSAIKNYNQLCMWQHFSWGLSSFNHISGFTEHHRFLCNPRVGGLANFRLWLYGKSIRRNKRMFNIIWNSKEKQTSIPLILSLWEQMDYSVLLPSSS